MAGSRQHFLPRVLIKGFASKIVGDQTYSLVFQNNKEPYEANITRIAVEKDFYTDSVDVDVDEAITELERKLGTTLDDLRRETSCVRIAGEKIVAFIANLLVRTQALRQKVLINADMSVDYFAKKLEADPGLLSRLTQHEAKKKADEFIKEAKKRGRNLDRYKRRLLIANFEQTANLTVAVYAPLMASYMMEFRKKMPGVAKTSHIKALAEQPTPARVDGLNKLRWSLFVAADGTFILGDIGPVCKSLESGSFEYLPTADDTKSLILPISHNRAIIGSREGSPGELNSDAVNQASAALSSKFFISDRDSEKERRYLQALGTQSMTLSRDEMAKILEEILVAR